MACSSDSMRGNLRLTLRNMPHPEWHLRELTTCVWFIRQTIPFHETATANQSPVANGQPAILLIAIATHCTPSALNTASTGSA